MVLDQRYRYASQWEAIRSIAAKIGRSSEALRKWVQRSTFDSGRKPGVMTDERKRVARLERVVFELRRANEILRKASRISHRRSLTVNRSDVHAEDYSGCGQIECPGRLGGLLRHYKRVA